MALVLVVQGDHGGLAAFEKGSGEYSRSLDNQLAMNYSDPNFRLDVR